VGLQVEYIYLKLNHGSFNTVLGSPLTGARGYEADDWGFGATAGLLCPARIRLSEPIAVTSKIFSTDFNPTVAYKLTLATDASDLDRVGVSFGSRRGRER
jgi:hypothetical protein